jgi:PilZ domain
VDRDKRKAPRIFYPCEVEVYGTGAGRTSGRIKVLSLRGAFVETSSVLPMDPIVLAAEVVHLVPEGMGVHFLALTRAQHTALQKAIEEKKG